MTNKEIEKILKDGKIYRLAKKYFKKGCLVEDKPKRGRKLQVKKEK